MDRRRDLMLMATSLAILALPLSACNKAPKSITELEAEHAEAPKPAYKDLTAVDPQIQPIIDGAKDANAATAAVLRHVDGKLAQTDDEAVLSYGKLLLARIAVAKAHHPADCQGVVHGDEDAIDRNADAKAEHAWMIGVLHPTHVTLQIHTVVIGAALPSRLGFQPKPGEGACDAAHDLVQDALSQPLPGAAAALRAMGISMGPKALGA